MRDAGPLLAIGGHEDLTGERTILRRVADLLDGRTLALVTAASKAPDKYVERYRDAFADLGVGIRPVPGDAVEGRRVLRESGGAFLTGGKQRRLVSRLHELGLTAELRAMHADGRVIAGTSAGASAQADRMLARDALVPGLGLVRGVVIDQHFSQRDRMPRLRRAVALDPVRLGIGIDEDTAVEIAGGRLTVLGTGTVTVLDGGDVTVLSADDDFELPASARAAPGAAAG